jgi:ubiquinone/menaquinone biosynthesis C-methylase UbiE
MMPISDSPPARRNGSGVRSYFANPRGWLGWLAGQVMAFGNRERNTWVVSLLNLHPADHVLEIAFGPGVGIGLVTRRVASGLDAGIDRSDVMLPQATTSRRSATSVSSYARELPRSFLTLPTLSRWSSPSNVAQFCPSPAETVAEIRRVLQPGGRIALAVQPRNKGANEQTANETAEMLLRALTGAGSSAVTQQRKATQPVFPVCAPTRK